MLTALMVTGCILALELVQQTAPADPPPRPRIEDHMDDLRYQTPEERAKREQAFLQFEERELRRKVRRFTQTFSEWMQLRARNSRAPAVDAKDFKREQELFLESRKLFDELARQPALKRYWEKKR